ncbi:MAG TPA: hypothetical protein VGF79_03375 [Bacteroidia bacterium]
MQLILSGSWWFAALCLMAGFIYSYLLYKPKFGSTPYKIAAVLRGLLIALLCFFLLDPVLVRLINRVEKPKVLMVMDNSESILADKKTAPQMQDFLKKWYAIKEQLGNDYEVEYLNAGGQTAVADSANFKEKKTNLSSVFDYINNTYDKQNIGAVILASDGIYNRGSNPIYKDLNQHSLLYTIGLGDSTIKRDLIVKEVNVNSIAYLNNDYPVEIMLAARACKNRNAVLTVQVEGKTFHTETISINSDDYFKSITVNLPADKPGTQHLVVSLTATEGEITILNNKKDVFIDIIDGREKILLAYAGPHPDIGAIKSALASNKNYEVLAMPLNQVNLAEIRQYSIAILHHLPSPGNNPKNLVTALRKDNIPIWLITGSITTHEQLSMISPFARVERNQGRFNESQAYLNSNFSAFTVDEKMRNTIAGLPPLKTPYGQYGSLDNTEVLLFQKIGSVNTKLPLWTFSNENGQKTAYLFGEGLWKWRMLDFVENENHSVTDDLIGKTIQYLASKEDKRKFRAYPAKNTFEEDENVKFFAELYNASYELVNTVDVKLTLTNSDKKVYAYTFSKSGKSYQLDLGLLAPGQYTYVVKADGITETINGKIIVTPLQTELVETKADFGLMRELSRKHQGKFMTLNEAGNLAQIIKNNEKVSSQSFNERMPDELISIKWVFALLLLLLTAEWFIRKYEGGY